MLAYFPVTWLPLVLVQPGHIARVNIKSVSWVCFVMLLSCWAWAAFVQCARHETSSSEKTEVTKSTHCCVCQFSCFSAFLLQLWQADSCREWGWQELGASAAGLKTEHGEGFQQWQITESCLLFSRMERSGKEAFPVLSLMRYSESMNKFSVQTWNRWQLFSSLAEHNEQMTLQIKHQFWPASETSPCLWPIGGLGISPTFPAVTWESEVGGSTRDAGNVNRRQRVAAAVSLRAFLSQPMSNLEKYSKELIKPFNIVPPNQQNHKLILKDGDLKIELQSWWLIQLVSLDH